MELSFDEVFQKLDSKKTTLSNDEILKYLNEKNLKFLSDILLRYSSVFFFVKPYMLIGLRFDFS